MPILQKLALELSAGDRASDPLRSTQGSRATGGLPVPRPPPLPGVTAHRQRAGRQGRPAPPPARQREDHARQVRPSVADSDESARAAVGAVLAARGDSLGTERADLRENRRSARLAGLRSPSTSRTLAVSLRTCGQRWACRLTCAFALAVIDCLWLSLILLRAD
jgi:hypothetical protein